MAAILIVVPPARQIIPRHRLSRYRTKFPEWSRLAFVDNPQTPAQGGGEPPIIAMGAAIANAIFDGSGKRHLQLPIGPTAL